jgi:hypothetical protein
VVGGGDPEQVARQVVEHGLRARAPGGSMHDPGLAPGEGGHVQVRPLACEGVAELAADQPGERLDRHQKALAGRAPEAAVVGLPPPVTRQWTCGW